MITLLSKSELQKATVVEENGEVVVWFYQAQLAGDNAKWVRTRCTRPNAPFHVILNNTQLILDGPPTVHRGR